MKSLFFSNINPQLQLNPDSNFFLNFASESYYGHER